MMKGAALHWRVPYYKREWTKRPDGRFNVWSWRRLHDDLLCRWVLIDVVGVRPTFKKREARR